MGYDYEIYYKKGNDNGAADTLLRMPENEHGGKNGRLVVGNTPSVKHQILEWLHLLLILRKVWEGVAMDFIEGLPMSNGKDIIWAWELWKEGEAAALELVDPTIKDSLAPNQMLRCIIHVGLLCAKERPTNRFSMSEILSMLMNGTAKPPLLKRPAFCFSGHSNAANEHLTRPIFYSANSLIISDLFAR
ncbi:cysteine-rich receptor-like protein kinase 6 [Prosopis cineraria]|uniref:cysteine-rich receptor-like protein kinase 6 n=1 Tax=Prosopis cineraria TaxID=364024 RepID=UPI0024103CA2|nr:cysteine-rich receptor-like protein kinase 6 [Prosopis cineraria]